MKVKPKNVKVSLIGEPRALPYPANRDTILPVTGANPGASETGEWTLSSNIRWLELVQRQ
jgi:hypothetical protein